MVVQEAGKVRGSGLMDGRMGEWMGGSLQEFRTSDAEGERAGVHPDRRHHRGSGAESSSLVH